MNFKINKNLIFKDLGIVDYQSTWDYQEKLLAELVDIKKGNRQKDNLEQSITDNYLLFCEHPHVYTLGKSGKKEHLLLSDNALASKNASFYKINRGGDITYHGLGQLVGYPIIDLENFFEDIHQYLRYLEEAIILTCFDFGLNAGRIPGLTGVWLDYLPEAKNPRKIAAFGVKTSRWVTMHGFALNVNTDLTYFENIIPCGIPDKAVTSLKQELNKEISMDLVKEKVLFYLIQLFQFNLK